MFGINRKKENLNKYFGNNHYQMKEKYIADELVVANLQRISSEVTDFGPMVETTEEKYIFETVVNEGKTNYREIFTGFITSDKVDYFDLPYVVNPTPFTNYFPETVGVGVPKLSLIWTQNDINHFTENKVEIQLKKN